MDNKLVMLIVDDNEINRKILNAIFKNEYITVEADNGLSAYEIMNERNDIDIILLDIMMPVMNGIEFLEMVKSKPEFAKIPIIVNTQKGEEENEIKALDCGADDFIIKPYNPKLVMRRVRNITQKTILERQKIEQDLKDTTERLESLIDTVPGGIGIFEVAQEITCLYFNDAMCDLLQYTKKDMKNNSQMDAMLLVEEADREELRLKIEYAVIHDIPLKCTIRIIQKLQTRIWVSLSAVKFRENKGHAIFHAVLTDITEEMRRQQCMREAMEELLFRAEHDMLTGLYNREKFYYATKEMLDNDIDNRYVIIQWNIDRFKVINDLYGSKVGDRVLRQMGARFKEDIGSEGVYGRLEADHFVCCVKKEFFENSLSRILVFLHNGLSDANVGYSITSRIGIYQITDINLSVDLMCDRANLALQTIRGNYLRRHAYYNNILRDLMIDEQELIKEMEQALLNKQFYINIQPIFDARTKIPVSAEALVRWNHPTKGSISPGVFIPVFEKNGFITKLDMFVWEEVCKLLAESKKIGIKILPISVNVSRLNFYSQDLCEKIQGLIKRYGLDSSMIKIEITESAYTDNPHQLLEIMELFQNNGFKILMDDFGSGYSSLNMLKDVPVDILKIDMKFIDQLETSERAGNILTNVIRMAKSLNMQVVAEGVETKNQYNFLNKMGCDCIQGYYFSEPLSPENYKKLMSIQEYQSEDEKEQKERKTILLVDNCKRSCLEIKNALEEEYDILMAENGEDALRILTSNSRTIDLIITELNILIMKGLYFLQIISEDMIFQHIPTVVLTDKENAEEEENALKMGAINVINKPANTALLHNRIKNLLRFSEGENIKSEFLLIKKNREVKNSIQNIIDNSKAGICRLSIKDGDTSIVYANRTFYSLRGLPKVEMENVDANAYLSKGILEKDFDAFIRKLEVTLEAKKGSMEYLYQKKNKENGMNYIHVNCGLQYLPNEYIIDMTEMEQKNKGDFSMK